MNELIEDAFGRQGVARVSLPAERIVLDNPGMEIEFVAHARRRMEERGVSEEIVSEILADAVLIRPGADEPYNTHYIKSVRELGGDTITVVVDPHERPGKVVTVMRESKEVRL